MSTSPPPAGLTPIPPNIAQITGPLVLGHFFNWALFGTLTVQAYVYYLAFPKDRTLPKAIVVFVYVLETLQTILTTRDGFRTLGSGWGDLIALNKVGWLWFSVPVLSSLITWTAQLFFAWRIWILSSQYWLPGLIAFLSIVQGVFGFWAGIYAHFINDFSQVQKHNFKITSVWLGGTALCDAIIAICMIYYLTKSRTGFRATNILIAKIIRVTIETGFVCATFAVIDLVLFAVYQNTNYHLAPSIPLSKLYSNSLLVVFNARVRFVGGRNSSPSEIDLSLSYQGTSTYLGASYQGTSMASELHKIPNSTPSRGGINVAVSREVYSERQIHIPMDDKSKDQSAKSGRSSFDISV